MSVAAGMEPDAIFAAIRECGGPWRLDWSGSIRHLTLTYPILTSDGRTFHPIPMCPIVAAGLAYTNPQAIDVNLDIAEAADAGPWEGRVLSMRKRLLEVCGLEEQ